MIPTDRAQRSPPELVSGDTLYVPLLEVLHWKCPSSLRSDNRVQSIGTNGPNTSGYRPNDFVAGGHTLLESPAECVGIRIPVKTPNPNACIESFHAILKSECYSMHEFDDFSRRTRRSWIT